MAASAWSYMVKFHCNQSRNRTKFIWLDINLEGSPGVQLIESDKLYTQTHCTVPASISLHSSQLLYILVHFRFFFVCCIELYKNNHLHARVRLLR